MSVNLPIGPLQITYTDGTTTTTGTIFVDNTVPAFAVGNASVTLNYPGSPDGPQGATVTGGQVQAAWQAFVSAPLGRVAPQNFIGTFKNNLQGSGTLTTEDTATPGPSSTLNWTAQLGE